MQHAALVFSGLPLGQPVELTSHAPWWPPSSGAVGTTPQTMLESTALASIFIKQGRTLKTSLKAAAQTSAQTQVIGGGLIALSYFH